MNEEHYRKIFVVEPSHDLSALKNHTDNIELLTTGYENPEDLPAKIKNNLKDFDPETDAFVPIGKLVSTMLAGMELQKKLRNAPIKVGIYKNRAYEFMSIGDPDGS